MSTIVFHFVAPNFPTQSPAFRFLRHLQQLSWPPHAFCLPHCHQVLHDWLVLSLLPFQRGLLACHSVLSTTREPCSLFLCRVPLPWVQGPFLSDVSLVPWAAPNIDYCPVGISWMNEWTNIRAFIHLSTNACWALSILGAMRVVKVNTCFSVFFFNFVTPTTCEQRRWMLYYYYLSPQVHGLQVKDCVLRVLWGQHQRDFCVDCFLFLGRIEMFSGRNPLSSHIFLC